MMRHGILLIDKPQGPTSHDVVEMARHALGVRQIGHMGTLDPLATGLLILGVGEGTKLAPFLSDLDKTYECTARLGARSTTYDAMGTIEMAGDARDVSLAQIAAAAERFRGTIEQKPPVFSAIKKAGRPLYDYARRGEAVETSPRRVRVYALDVLAWNPPDLSLRMHVSSGTYVRSIVHDLGEALGVGAYVNQLRRTQAGPFHVDDAVAIAGAEGFGSDIEKAWRTLAQALGHWTRVRIPDALVGAVKNGATVNAVGLESVGGALHHDHLYALVDARERLLAVARCLVSRGDMSVAGGGARRGDLVLKPVRGFNEE
ncbi:MAG: tRNA pseudouridine(55) synthase TruB [Candidatus Sumerlaeia bacterium]|nr:tRNA pseudouridine(55) synthase TruB [Candidatus Sumerlaeia bacterium]